VDLKANADREHARLCSLLGTQRQATIKALDDALVLAKHRIDAIAVYQVRAGACMVSASRNFDVYSQLRGELRYAWLAPLILKRVSRDVEGAKTVKLLADRDSCQEAFARYIEAAKAAKAAIGGTNPSNQSCA
jgi:hypothetical protein